MPKALPSNNMPWPENLIFDFSLPAETSPAEAEAFISSIETSDRNREFLRLRYLEGRSYKEIASEYNITAPGVRMAIKSLWERYALQINQTTTNVDDGVVDEQPVTTTMPVLEEEPVPTEDQQTAAVKDEIGQTPRPELRPIITAIGTTTRQRTFVYDTRTQAVLPSDNVPRGLRHDSRYVPLPDYYQIKECDLMKEFAAAQSDPSRTTLEGVLGGVGPFRAFRQKVKEIGLEQEWAAFRLGRFTSLAAEWWDANVPSPAALQPSDDRSYGDSAVAADERLIVDPATLNGIALIETIRILFRRVDPSDFEAALDELRDAMCSTPIKTDAQGEE